MPCHAHSNTLSLCFLHQYYPTALLLDCQTVAESDLVRSAADTNENTCIGHDGETSDKRVDADGADIECGCANEDDDGAHVCGRQEQAICTSEAERASSVFDLGDDEAAFVRLPPSPPAPNGSRLVPNCCAVCLCPYEIGETLAWSSNTSCRHAFHQDCVVEYLCKVQEVDCPCPCCRGTFVELPNHLDGEGGKKRKRFMSDVTRTSSFETDEAQLAFNTNRVSL